MPSSSPVMPQPALAAQHQADSAAGDLIAGATRGDWASWRQILTRYERLVLHTAAKMGLSSSDASDVAQLTWLRLWEHGDQIREPARLTSWLISTARREAMRVAAASGKYVLHEDLSRSNGRTGVLAAFDVYPGDLEYEGIVAAAMERLPARYRTLLWLLSSDLELSYSEVAACMGLPIGSIGPMRMRAIRMLEKTPEFASRDFPRSSPAAS